MIDGFIPFAPDPLDPASQAAPKTFNWQNHRAAPPAKRPFPKITGEMLNEVLDKAADADLGPISRIAKNNLGRAALKGAVQYAAAPEHKRMMIGGGIAATGALLTNIFNDKNDSVLDTARDMTVAAGLEIGADKALERFGMNKAALIAQAFTPKELRGTVGSMVQEGMKKHGAKPVFSKGTATGAVIGGVVGAISGDRDGMGSVVDAAIGAGAGYGVGVLVEQWADDTGGLKMKVADVAKAQTEEEAKELAIQRANKFNRFKGKAAIGVAALIGLGTLASVRNDLDHEVRADQMVAEQEKRQVRKTNKEKEMMSEMFGWNQNVNMGQLAIDMFNDRIGHHLMGNAKFQ